MAIPMILVMPRSNVGAEGPAKDRGSKHARAVAAVSLHTDRRLARLAHGVWNMAVCKKSLVCRCKSRIGERPKRLV